MSGLLLCTRRIRPLGWNAPPLSPAEAHPHRRYLDNCGASAGFEAVPSSPIAEPSGGLVAAQSAQCVVVLAGSPETPPRPRIHPTAVTNVEAQE